MQSSPHNRIITDGPREENRNKLSFWNFQYNTVHARPRTWNKPESVSSDITWHHINLLHSHWSRNIEVLLSLVEFWPFLRHFLPVDGSLWHKGGFNAGKGSILGTVMEQFLKSNIDMGWSRMDAMARTWNKLETVSSDITWHHLLAECSVNTSC